MGRGGAWRSSVQRRRQARARRAEQRSSEWDCHAKAGQPAAKRVAGREANADGAAHKRRRVRAAARGRLRDAAQRAVTDRLQDAPTASKGDVRATQGKPDANASDADKECECTRQQRHHPSMAVEEPPEARSHHQRTTVANTLEQTVPAYSKRRLK